MANYIYKKCRYVHFLREGSEKMYVLYIHLKVDNYGKPLRFQPFDTYLWKAILTSVKWFSKFQFLFLTFLMFFFILFFVLDKIAKHHPTNNCSCTVAAGSDIRATGYEQQVLLQKSAVSRNNLLCEGSNCLILQSIHTCTMPTPQTKWIGGQTYKVCLNFSSLFPLYEFPPRTRCEERSI